MNRGSVVDQEHTRYGNWLVALDVSEIRADSDIFVFSPIDQDVALDGKHVRGEAQVGIRNLTVFRSPWIIFCSWRYISP